MTAGTVTGTMKRLGIVSALAATAVAVWYLQRPRAASELADEVLPPATASPRANSSRGAPGSARPAAAVSEVTRLPTTEARRELADRIAGARANRAAIQPARSQLPEQASPVLSPTQIRDAMREVILHLAACYRTAVDTLPSASLSIVAEITLSGDPDVGTLIDAKALVDDFGQPLPAAFDDCLRATFHTLALPPLADGDQVEVRYPFMFSSL